MKKTLVQVRLHRGLFLLSPSSGELVILLIQKSYLYVFVSEQYGTLPVIWSNNEVDCGVVLQEFN